MKPHILSTLEEKIAPAHTALLVIDMLNDFLDPKGKTATRANRPIGGARAVIPNIAALADSARAAGVLVVFVQHTTLPDYASASGPWLDARSRATYSTEDICERGTWGHQVIPELPLSPQDILVEKYRYSGFPGTALDLILRSRQIKTVICCGVSTNACVEATAREAFSLDYYVVYPQDACASWDKDLHEATLRTAAGRYATVVPIERLAAVWHQRA